MHARVPAPRSDYPFLDGLRRVILGNSLACTRTPIRYWGGMSMQNLAVPENRASRTGASRKRPAENLYPYAERVLTRRTPPAAAHPKDSYELALCQPCATRRPPRPLPKASTAHIAAWSVAPG